MGKEFDHWIQAKGDVDMEEQFEKLNASASSVTDLAAPWELDVLLVDADSLAQVIRKECFARMKVLSEHINDP